MNNTVIYLRTRSTPPMPGSNILPRKGTPIGAIAYTIEDGVLEVAYALQNPKDTWNRARSRRIVTKRLELKRESCTKQFREPDGGTHDFETVPKYFRLELDAPVLDNEEAPSTRPYDILQLIVEAHENNQIKVPERLIKTIVRMQSDNEQRVKVLAELAAAKGEIAIAAEDAVTQTTEVATVVATSQ